MPEWNPASLVQSVLFAPLHPLLAHFKTNDFPRRDDLNALLAARQSRITMQSGLPLRFVAHQSGKLPLEMQYEPRCYLHGEVQMRSGEWHDLLNALVWMTLPKAKAAINARHYQDLISTNGSPSQRSARHGHVIRRVRHDCSLCRCRTWPVAARFQVERIILATAPASEYLDGILFIWPRAISKGVATLCWHDWPGFAGGGRTGIFSWPPAQQLGHLDEMLAAYLNAPQHCRSTRELAPVPLLGVPGWTQDNAVESYYNNTEYFRAGRLTGNN